MGVGQKVLISSVVVVLVLGLLLYSPLHPNIDEPFKVRCFLAIFKIGKFLVSCTIVFATQWCTFNEMKIILIQFIFDNRIYCIVLIFTILG